MASSTGRSQRIALIGGTLGVAAGLGALEARYPEHHEKIASVAKAITLVSAFMAVKGGKHGMKFAWVAMALGATEARSLGRDLASP